MARRHLANADLRSIALSPDAGLQALCVRLVLNVVAAATVSSLSHFVLRLELVDPSKPPVTRLSRRPGLSR